MPLLWISLAFVSGILLADMSVRAGLMRGATSALVWLSLAAVCLSYPLLRWLAGRIGRYAPLSFSTSLHRLSGSLIGRWMEDFSHKLRLPVYILLAAFSLGAARHLFSLPDVHTPGFIASYNDADGEYVVVGVLVKPAEVFDGSLRLWVQTESISPTGSRADQPVHGLLLARVAPGGSWRYGDRLRLSGRLEAPPEGEGFSYRQYLARQGVFSYMSFARAELVQPGQGNPILARIYALRERAVVMTYRLYPDPEASLLAGIVLGVESGIPESVQQAFRDTGTAHIIAISGFNFAVISGLFATLFIRLLGAPRRFLAAALTILFIAFYAVLVGAGASVVRAAVMGSLSLFAVQLGRRQASMNSLAFVAAIMALFNSNILWDVGFQLSFAATLGLVWYAEPLERSFVRLASRALPLESAQRLARPVGEYFLFSLAALATTLPVILYHFQWLSLTALIANPAILPVQPAVMVLGGLGILFGLLYLPLGQAVAYLAWPFVAYTIRVVELLALIPGGVVAIGKVSLVWVAAYYACLLLLTISGRPAARLAALIKPSLVLAGLWALAVLAWRAAFSAPDGRLHLTVLDVGSGDALLIRSPSGRYILIDGGPNASKLSEALGRRLPPTWRRLDWLVVAAPEAAQIAALPTVLERYPADNVLWAGATNAGHSARLLQDYFNSRGIQPVVAQAGMALDLGKGTRLHLLSAGEGGAVLFLEWHRFRALLPIGLEAADLPALQADPSLSGVSALLLADGGAADLNPAEWIAKLQPQVVLLSAGADDPPDPGTIQIVEGYTLLRTDRTGWIELTTDGEQMWVEVER